MTEVTVPAPTGLLNKEIVDLAYMALGLNDSMFGRTDEEHAAGMIMLRAMMNEYPFNQLSFDDADPRIGEDSGIERKYLTAVAYNLAKRIGDTIGKSLKPGAAATHGRSLSALSAEVAPMTETGHALGTPRGAGHRGWRPTYFTESE